MAFALGPKALAAGFRLAVYETIGSTSTEALAWATLGDPGRLWVVGKLQTAGHGRRGRSWQTPPGNLAASLLIIQSERVAAAATLGFAAGLALESAIRIVAPSVTGTAAASSRQNPPPLRGRVPLSLAKGAGEGEVYDLAPAANRGAPPLPVGSADHPLPQGERVCQSHGLQLKWPNDVLINDAKVAGILLEAVTLSNARTSVVIGIGVNVRSAPQGIPYPVTSLAERGTDVSAETLFTALAEAWVDQEELWNEGRGFAAIRDRWLERAAGLGAPIAVKIGDDVLRGTFETIDDEGRLVVRAGDGSSRAVSAGEVHFGAASTAGF